MPDAAGSDRIGAFAERVYAEMHKAVVGQDELIEMLMVALLANGHVLLEGVPGTAKTLSV
ncbi:MAG TPA: magnesium chelatase, partial [Chloroflexota bacterium]|nr:magnesium chelatase [Chloroflexota bacterium]